MTNAACTLVDRFWIKIGVGSPGENNEILWDHFIDWDYSQTNDQQIWDGEPEFDDQTMEADALLKRDPSSGFEQFHAMAETGSVWAMEKVGHCYHVGRGVARDEFRAEQWYRRSLKAGCNRAMLDLGNLLRRQKDFSGAEAMFSRGAADDWPPALFWLAWNRLQRRFPRRPLAQTLALLEKASAMGSPAAEFYLAVSLARGRFGLEGIPRGLKLMRASNAKHFAVVQARRKQREASTVGRAASSTTRSSAGGPPPP